MTDLIDTTEMYLRTILELEEENIVALRARIAERARHSVRPSPRPSGGWSETASWSSPVTATSNSPNSGGTGPPA